MLLSFCIPCMNRAYDLKRSLPYMIRAANASPPVEIAVLDYNSQDDLAEFMEMTMSQPLLIGGNSWRYSRYTAREHYHLAHAWNLAVLSSSGSYICIMGTDAVPSVKYVAEARKLIGGGCVWMRGKHYKGILVCNRQEFILAGGYDERFEFYGSEDRDLDNRLQRRGGKFGLMPDGVVRTFRTTNKAKVSNFRLGLTKLEMILQNKAILRENDARAALVVNEGMEWGSPNGKI